MISEDEAYHLLSLRYMERRCKILEACPSLQFNEGRGEVIIDDDGKRTVTKIEHLRSLLFQTMLREVSNFCDMKDGQGIVHQQVMDLYRYIFHFILLLCLSYFA